MGIKRSNLLLFAFVLLVSARPLAAAGSGYHPNQFLKHWLVLKPIPVTGPDGQAPDDVAQRKAFDHDWLCAAGGETNLQPRAGTKLTIGSQELKWQQLASRTDIIDLMSGSSRTDNSIAYVWTEIEAPLQTNIFLGLGSDDAVKVWLNGKLIHQNWTFRPAGIDDDLVPVELARGRNQLLLKIQNGGGGWGFACRFMDAETAQPLQLFAENRKHSRPDSLTDAEIQTMLQDCIDGSKLAVGLVVGLVDAHGPRVVSYGKKDCRTSEAVDGDTLFEIGSITKVFTRLLLLDMVERGEMKLDDPVQQYLPSSVRMPAHRGKPITLLQLAWHRSGLPRDALNLAPRTWRNPYADYTVEQLYAFLSGHKLRRDPGAQYEYSNLGVALLGHVISLKAGKDYETLVLERICRPLKMDSTRITLTPELKARRATGHGLPDRPLLDWDFQTLLGAGALHSTANDMLKFASACLGLTPSNLTPLMQKWGCGHEGGTAGFSSALLFDMAQRRAVAVLSNCQSEGTGEKLETLLNNKSPKPPRTAEPNCALPDAYAGQYRSGDGSVVTVRRESNRLLFSILEQSRRYRRAFGYELFPLSQTVFYNQLFELQAAFVPDAQGQALRLKVFRPQKPVWEGTKLLTPLPASPDTLKLAPQIYDQYAGRYQFALGPFHIGPVVSISHESDSFGDHLVISSPAFLGAYLGGGEMYPSAENTFIIPLANAEFSFERNKKGNVTRMIARCDIFQARLARVGNLPAK